MSSLQDPCGPTGESQAHTSSTFAVQECCMAHSSFFLSSACFHPVTEGSLANLQLWAHQGLIELVPICLWETCFRQTYWRIFGPWSLATIPSLSDVAWLQECWWRVAETGVVAAGNQWMEREEERKEQKGERKKEGKAVVQVGKGSDAEMGSFATMGSHSKATIRWWRQLILLRVRDRVALVLWIH